MSLQGRQRKTDVFPYRYARRLLPLSGLEASFFKADEKKYVTPINLYGGNYYRGSWDTRIHIEEFRKSVTRLFLESTGKTDSKNGYRSGRWNGAVIYFGAEFGSGVRKVLGGLISNW